MSEYKPAWFCVRSQPKHEHIAAAHLKREPGIEVYLPRVRFKRATRRGPVWFTEALFPNYLFARVTLGEGPVHVIRQDLQPGEAVQIAGGVFHGLRAVVTRVMPSRERVAVLLEFLGRQTTVELPTGAVIRDMDERKLVL